MYIVINIIRYIYNNIVKQGAECEGRPVISLDKYKSLKNKKPIIVCIGRQYTYSILEHLKDNHIESFSTLYWLYRINH